ncbi:histidine kinase dimerization/phosphoacceptor domain-containing protein [Streptomyces sp. NPDC004284]|uniref:histidine kinase dimerization/phosphoacceptor domain-containing protein n=1 Tax=Streptomyces sp. NPDC004284 TaxID=3364695 RepID=UPI0036A6870F
MPGREAFAEERLRIAGELHDIVSHSLGVIVVKAAVARHVAEERPEEVREAVRTIEHVGPEALTEMRRALGVLRATSPYRAREAPVRRGPRLLPASTTCRPSSGAPSRRGSAPGSASGRPAPGSASGRPARSPRERR